MAETENELEGGNGQALDERGTGVEEGLGILSRLRDGGFEADDTKLAVALGRPIEEVEAWMRGSEPPDDDIIMKARGIAEQRGIEIE